MNPAPVKDKALIDAVADKVFFEANNETDRANKNKLRESLTAKFEVFRKEYNAARDILLADYGAAQIQEINNHFSVDVLEGLRQARENYVVATDRVRDLELARSYEHCLGAVENKVLESVVGQGSGAEDPFFVPGEPGTIGGLPGMGFVTCLLYTSPSPRDQRGSRMPSSA